MRRHKSLLDIFSLAAIAGILLYACRRLFNGQDAEVPLRCRSSGSLQLGTFQGPTPFSLEPLESLQSAVEGAGAWPAANPVSRPGDAGVLAPFLFPAEDRVYAFYEEARCSGEHSDRGYIAAAESVDGGLTWRRSGEVLREPGGLSSPFVFQDGGEVYMVPSSPHDVGLYRATSFPSSWERLATLLPAPLHSLSLVPHNGSWWLFGSSGGGTGEGSTQEVFRAPLLRGPFTPHASLRVPAEMFSRAIEGEAGALLRLGRPCEGGRCSGVAAFQVELGESAGYAQHQLVPAPLLAHSRQPAAWDGGGFAHLDLVQLPTGAWLAAATGASLPPQLAPAALALQLAAPLLTVMAVSTLLAVALVGLSRLGAPQRLLGRSGWGRQVLAHVRPAVLLSCGGPRAAEVPDAPTAYVSITPRAGGTMKGKHQAAEEAWQPASRAKRRGAQGGRWRAVAVAGGLAALVGAAAAANMAQFALEPFWQPAEAVALEGGVAPHSKFTLMVMSYDKRLESLRYYISHYSQCPSVGEVLVVWNKGPPPDPQRDLPSQVPVRVRVEAQNSMNNRYRPDPEIRYRAVLSLDDDIMMPCADIEHGFAAWRARPHKIVGFYPRLITQQGPGGRLEYNWEDATVRQGRYNALLTGAAFLDSRTAFPLYWAEAAAPARALVDELVNCDDLLMNWVIFNATRAAALQRAAAGRGGSAGVLAPDEELEYSALEFVRPQRRVDISYLSGVGLSHAAERFQQQAERCLAEFAGLFGGNIMREERFDWGRHRAPLCSLTGRAFGCLYL